MKIALIVTSKIFERNYLNKIFLDSDATDDIVILRRHELPGHNEFGASQISYKIESWQTFLSKILFKVELLRKLNRSKTFKFRLARALHWPEIRLHFGLMSDKDRSLRSADFVELARLFAKFSIATLVHVSLVPLILTPKSLFSYFLRATEGQLGLQLTKLRPDLIIFPFTGYEIEQNYLPGISKAIGSKLAFCTDNWDNMSSKTVISFMPDLITVWGEQTKKHAIEIQGIPVDRVIIAPSPRLAVYKNSLPASRRQYVIGFVGAFLSFDEIEALEILEGVLNKRFDETGETWTIFYRPHPWRMAQSECNRLSKLKRVTLPEEFRNVYTNNAWDTNFQPSLDGYPDYFEKCDFIVGGLTTMMLEAMLSKRRVIAIAYWDNKYNLYSPGAAYANYEHFEGVNKLGNIALARTKDEFVDLLRNEIYDTKEFKDDQLISHYVNFDVYLTKSRLLAELKAN